MAPDEVSYEAVVNRWRREVASGPTELSRIDRDFYQTVEQYLRDLQEEYTREHNINPASGKAMLLRDELVNLRRAIEDLYDQRERKIVLLALTAARGGNPERLTMTKGERDLYESLVRALKEGRRNILRRGERTYIEPPAFEGDGEGLAPPADPDAPKAQPAPEGDGEAVPEAPLPGFDGDGDGAGVGADGNGDGDGGVPASASGAPDGTDPARPAEAAGAGDGDGGDDGASEAPPGQGSMGSGRVLVRLLEEVPPFTASDLRTYRLKAEDVAALPPEAAEALVARGKAKRLAEAASE